MSPKGADDLILLAVEANVVAEQFVLLDVGPVI